MELTDQQLAAIRDGKSVWLTEAGTDMVVLRADVFARLKVWQEIQSEIATNYPYFRQFVYAKVREEFERTLLELPDKDLETVAQEDGALPLEAFIGDLE